MSIKILSAEQVREADRRTLEEQNISSLELMEQASAAFVRAFVKLYDTQRTIYIFCGTGNNGGDGLAIARLLLKQQYQVDVWLVGDPEKGSPDFLTNKERLERYHVPKTFEKSDDFPQIPPQGLIIDALFGSGLSRPIEGFRAELIRAINSCGAEVVSVDVPSGVYLDKPEEEGSAIVCADLAITFQVPKLAFMLPDSGKWVLGWKMVPIGLSERYLQEVETPYCFTDHKTVSAIYQKRSKWSHKGDYGKILLVAGSKGKIGAVVLCARACLRAGAGLLTVHVPAVGYSVLQTAVPEAMTLVDADSEAFSSAPDVAGFTILGVGPGMGTSEKTYKAFKELLQAVKVPMVLDADALNLLAQHPDLLELLPRQAILTPHPKEFERLVGEWSNGFERLEKQREFSRQWGVVVVLKGPHSSITAPDGRVFFNSTGNPGLATGGTGDVLTGVLAATLGQGYDTLDAAILGVFLHGLAADLAAKALGQEGLIASDLIDYLPKAYQKLADPTFTVLNEVF